MRHGPACPKLLDFGVARLVARTHEIGRGADALGRRAAERADQLALATLAWRFLGSMSAPVSARAATRDEPGSEPTVPFGSSARRGIGRSVGERGRGIGYEGGGDEDTRRRIFPVSPIRLAPAVGALPSGLAASRPPPAAATPVLAGAPSSLTQQFFAEGEQLEMAHVAGQTSDAGSVAEADEEGELETAAPRACHGAAHR